MIAADKNVEEVGREFGDMLEIIRPSRTRKPHPRRLVAGACDTTKESEETWWGGEQEGSRYKSVTFTQVTVLAARFNFKDRVRVQGANTTVESRCIEKEE